MFHYRLDLAAFDRAALDGYRQVNRARRSWCRCSARRPIWVHDYHLIPLAASCARWREAADRLLPAHPAPRRGSHRRCPAPSWPMRSLSPTTWWASRPSPPPALRATTSRNGRRRRWRRRSPRYGQTVLRRLPDRHRRRRLRGAGRTAEDRATCARPLRRDIGRPAALGVDRLDYTKGSRSVCALRACCCATPGNRRSATLLQIAAPTREDVPAYDDMRASWKRGRAHQRRLRRARLDAGPLRQPQVRAPARCPALPRRRGRPRDAAARRHEPGGQGIRGGQDPADPRRAGAVALRRRGRAAEARMTGEPVRRRSERRRRCTRRCRCRSRSGASAMRA